MLPAGSFWMLYGAVVAFLASGGLYYWFEMRED